MPAVSVVIPCFNYGKFLPETLQCLQKQKFTDWECIIIDDGSTDNTSSIVGKFVASDKRFFYHYQQNAGLSAARNTGVRKVTGKFIQLLDADDLITSEKFDRQLSLFETEPGIDIIYSDFVVYDEKDKNFKRGNFPSIKMERTHPFLDFISRWENGFSIPIHSFLFRKSCFDEILFNTSLLTHEDIDLHLKMALKGFRYLHHQEKLAVYRIHPDSMVRNLTSMHRGFLQAISSLLREKNIPHQFHHALKRRYALEYFNTLLDILRGKKIDFRRAIPHEPLLNCFAITLLPLNLLLKFFRVIMNRLSGGTKMNLLPGFTIDE